MNVLVLGSGGREHALADKISLSKKLTKLYCAPGNPGTELICQNVNLSLSDFDQILDFCINNKIDLVVVGPEQPLVDGIADYLESNGIAVFGPKAAASRLEGDKSYSKELMNKYNIPTAAFKTFDASDKEYAVNYIQNNKLPIVIKASGLAAGKGVFICNSNEEAKKALNKLFEDKIFGESGSTIVIEDFMDGVEASIFAVCDGKEYVVLPSAQDHKRIFENDEGPNTGGMGAFSPAPIVSEKLLNKIESQIIKPALNAAASEGTPYCGCLYCGLMIVNGEPKVVEFNCRFGDPEIQAVLQNIDGDFLQLLYSAAVGKIDKNAVSYNGGNSVIVVAASEGYPGKYKKGKVISGINESFDNIKIFHAGTNKSGNAIVTSGGRVLGITAYTKDSGISYCRERVYSILSNIYFEGIYYRKDIAYKALK